MAEICCANDNTKTTQSSEPSSREARRRRMEIRRFKIVAGISPSPESEQDGVKRQKLSSSLSRDCTNAVDNCVANKPETKESLISAKSLNLNLSPSTLELSLKQEPEFLPKYGFASVCGRRRDMEDTVAIQPYFYRESSEELHYFGVYDGHGCSHVAMRCGERLHELVKEEIEAEEASAAAMMMAGWKGIMERSFCRMDKEVIAWNEEETAANCRCEMQTPECDAVGSTAVVAVVTPDKIIVANCGDSRAVLCRNGKPIPLSSDHKPDRPDELDRIQAAGGRVIYWDGPRVLGVLAMSRAIGDNYLKPYVSCEPEVTVTERTPGDDCLILASDGLWDVVSNETACGVARMCLTGKAHAPPLSSMEEVFVEGGGGGGACSSVGVGMSDKACSDASMLLTKLALARHTADNVSVVVVDLRRDT